MRIGVCAPAHSVHATLCTHPNPVPRARDPGRAPTLCTRPRAQPCAHAIPHPVHATNPVHATPCTLPVHVNMSVRKCANCPRACVVEGCVQCYHQDGFENRRAHITYNFVHTSVTTYALPRVS